jgi:hypothetical protein
MTDWVCIYQVKPTARAPESFNIQLSQDLISTGSRGLKLGHKKNRFRVGEKSNKETHGRIFMDKLHTHMTVCCTRNVNEYKLHAEGVYA